MEAIKIPFTPIDLPHRQHTDIKECYIELGETYVRYFAEFFADDENDLGVTENCFSYFNILAMKVAVSGIELSYTTDKKWMVWIRVSGFHEDIRLIFRSKSNSQNFYDKIQEWLLK